MGKNIEDQMEIVLKPASVRRLETFDEAIIHTRFKTMFEKSIGNLITDNSSKIYLWNNVISCCGLFMSLSSKLWKYVVRSAV